jgi:glycerol uptake facilitator-like aquaporin
MYYILTFVIGSLIGAVAMLLYYKKVIAQINRTADQVKKV